MVNAREYSPPCAWTSLATGESPVPYQPPSTSHSDRSAVSCSADQSRGPLSGTPPLPPSPPAPPTPASGMGGLPPLAPVLPLVPAPASGGPASGSGFPPVESAAGYLPITTLGSQASAEQMIASALRMQNALRLITEPAVRIALEILARKLRGACVSAPGCSFHRQR